MRVKNLKNNACQDQGTVLLVVLMIISILVVVAIEGFRSSQIDISNAYLFSHGLETGNLNRSALSYARSLLAYDSKENDFDHYGEIWANAQEQNEVRAPQPAKGSFALQISDESGKLPVNYLAEKVERKGDKDQDNDKDKKNKYYKTYQTILKQILIHQPFELQEEEADELIKSLVDWIDQDENKDRDQDEENEYGEYYADFDTTNNTKNAPVKFISELLLVEGMTEELYYGPNEAPGLKDLLTAYSKQGKININTASTYLLQAMVPTTVHWDTAVEFAKNMQSYRQDRMHWDFLEESDWYKNRMPGYNDIELPSQIVSTSSTHFAVSTNATIGDICSHVFAYIHKEPVDKDEDDEEKQAKLSFEYLEYY